MKRLSDVELNAYLASGEWQGKAGGYGIQGMAAAFIPWISGSFTGIVGLPLAETAALLQAAGWPLYRGQP
jgi:septum formation protein